MYFNWMDVYCIDIYNIYVHGCMLEWDVDVLCVFSWLHTLPKNVICPWSRYSFSVATSFMQMKSTIWPDSLFRDDMHVFHILVFPTVV